MVVVLQAFVLLCRYKINGNFLYFCVAESAFLCYNVFVKKFRVKPGKIKGFSPVLFRTRETKERYTVWRAFLYLDTLLNDIYQYLEKALPADEFEVLESEQIQWIKEKEEAIENATNEWSGGSGEAMVHFGTAAEYTKDRCYYLLTYISN